MDNMFFIKEEPKDLEEDSIEVKEELIECNDSKDQAYNQPFEFIKCEPEPSYGETVNDTDPQNHTDLDLIKCLICDEQFSGPHNLNLHMKNHIGIKEVQCSICNKHFGCNSELDKHMKSHGNIKQKLRENTTKSAAQRLQEYRARRKTLIANVTQSHANISVTSTVWSSAHSFLYETSLKRHMKPHEKPNNKETELNNYVKMHGDSDAKKCLICDKLYVTRYDLKVHMKYHLGIKEFQCTNCNKRYARKYDLGKHMKTHARSKDEDT